MSPTSVSDGDKIMRSTTSWHQFYFVLDVRTPLERATARQEALLVTGIKSLLYDFPLLML